MSGQSTFSLLAILKQFVDIGSFIREDEILKFAGIGNQFGKNATDIDAIGKKFFGSRSNSRDLTKDIGNFVLKPFESKEALEDYLKQSNLGIERGREGICFAF